MSTQTTTAKCQNASLQGDVEPNAMHDFPKREKTAKSFTTQKHRAPNTLHLARSVLFRIGR
jgi:hypothetical protein